MYTHDMAAEMRLARGVSILPNGSLGIDHLGGSAVFIAVANTGVGPALEVEVTSKYEPDASGISVDVACA